MSMPPSPVPASVATAATQPLIVADNLDAPLAWRDGAPISRRHYLADMHALAARLPAAGPMLNFTADRYRFAVGLGAAMLRGQASLMPPNHTTDTVARLHTLFPSIYALTDADAPTLQLPTIHYNDNAVAIPAERDAHPAFPAWPEIDDTALAATAAVHGLVVVTRNVAHLRDRGVPLLDPFKRPAEFVQPTTRRPLSDVDGP